MSTGCICPQPGCGGLAPGRGQMCAGCRVEAIRNPATRTAARAIQRLLNGRDWDARPSRLRSQREPLDERQA
jgi:hypothetical protein